MSNSKILVGYSGSILESLIERNHYDKTEIIIFEDDEKRLSLINKYDYEFVKTFSFKEGKKFIESSKNIFEVFISVSSSPLKRYQVRNLFISKNIKFPNFYHKTARTSLFGEFSSGLYLGDYVTIEANAYLNEFTFINNHSHIGHDSKVGKYCVLGGGVIINGYCNVGDFCLIGSSVTVINGKKIGMGSVIQAGSVVTSDIPAFSFASGNPCKKVCSSKLLGKQFRIPQDIK